MALYNELEDLFERFCDITIPRDIDVLDERSVKGKFSKNNIILNSYADSIQGEEGTPLEVLNRFSALFLKGRINGCHILPFYSWDTDRGFSVLDYYKVDSRNGTWDQFNALEEVFDILMVDCVLNHASLDNSIVQNALIGNPDYQDFILIFDEENKPSKEDLIKITRARPYPVLTQYYVVDDGNKHFATFDKPQVVNIIKEGWVWTTFSRPNNPDGSVATRQVDLNFQNPKVFLEIVKIILLYISKGASWIRLDAIGYLWKKIGTNCLHLPETHIFLEILAEIFQYLESFNIVLISEVNEPQERALQYLSFTSDHKSDMIYLFTHFPLAVHAVLTGSAKYYQKWLPSLKVAKGQLFVSILGTHDGMGMKPIGNWLPDSEKSELKRILIHEHGALANYARLPGGEKIVYELCSTPWNFINKEGTLESFELQLNRYLAVFALGLMIKGVPSIYINGLLGISNNKNPLDENRTINRQILNEKEISSELQNKRSSMFLVLEKLMELISIRKKEIAFDLNGSYKVLLLNESVVSVLLISSTNKDNITALVNVSNSKVSLELNCNQLGFHGKSLTDLISKKVYNIPSNEKLLRINLSPYQISWLR